MATHRCPSPEGENIMEYASIGSTGSRISVPEEWGELLGRVREYPQASQLWFLRAVSAFNYSASQHVADRLNLATPLVPTGGFDAARRLMVRWLEAPELSNTD